MKVRNCEIRVFNRPERTKIVCAKFGKKSTSVFVTADEQNDISLWKNTKDKPLMTLRNNTSPFAGQPKRDYIKKITFDSSEQEVITGLTLGSIVMWDIAKQKVSLNFQAHDSEITDIALFEGEESKSLFATSARNGITKIWDRRKKGEVSSLVYSKSPITSVVATWENKIMAIGDEEGAISIWDLGNYTRTETVATLRGKLGAVTALNFISDGTYLLAGFSNCSLQLLDLINISFCDHNMEIPDYPSNILQVRDYNSVLISGRNFFRAVSLGDNTLTETDSLDNKWGFIFDTIARDTNENSVVSLANDGDKLSLWMTTYNSVNWFRKEAMGSTARFDSYNQETQKDLDKELSSFQPESKEVPAEIQPEFISSIMQGGFLEMNETRDLMDTQSFKIAGEIAAINEIARDHPKVIDILSQRNEHVLTILRGIERHPREGLGQLWGLTEPSLIYDTTRALSSYKRLNNFNIESSTFLIQKMIILIESRFQHHISYGLSICLEFLKLFETEIFQFYKFVDGSKIDFAKEERGKKYGNFVEVIQKALNLKRMNVITNSKYGELSVVANNFKMSTETLLRKIKK